MYTQVDRHVVHAVLVTSSERGQIFSPEAQPNQMNIENAKDYVQKPSRKSRNQSVRFKNRFLSP